MRRKVIHHDSDIQTEEITRNIKEMCIEANHFLAEDMEHAMKKAAEEEKSELGKKFFCSCRKILKLREKK